MLKSVFVHSSAKLLALTQNASILGRIGQCWQWIPGIVVTLRNSLNLTMNKENCILSANIKCIWKILASTNAVNVEDCLNVQSNDMRVSFKKTKHFHAVFLSRLYSLRLVPLCSILSSIECECLHVLLAEHQSLCQEAFGRVPAACLSDYTRVLCHLQTRSDFTDLLFESPFSNIYYYVLCH